MAALHTDGVQGTEKKEEPVKSHSRNGSIEKYFFKKKTDPVENNTVKENGCPDVATEDKISKADSPKVIDKKDKENLTTDLENDDNVIMEEENEIKTSSDICKNDVGAKMDLVKVVTKVQPNSENEDTNALAVPLESKISGETDDNPPSQENEESKMADKTNCVDAGNLDDPVSDIVVSKETDLQKKSCDSSDKHSENSAVQEKQKEAMNTGSAQVLQSLLVKNFNIARPKLKQKARKSSKPLAIMNSSCIKTVNLAPIANFKVKLPDFESALNLGSISEGAKIINTKKPVAMETEISKPESISKSTPLPLKEECSSKPQPLPVTNKKVAMASRSRHQRKRSRRWGKGDLPLRKNKKKHPMPILKHMTETDTMVNVDFKSELKSLDVKKSAVTDSLSNCNVLDKKDAMNSGTSPRPKATSTIVQLLNKHRPKISSKNLSLLRAKKLKVNASERIAKSATDIIMENHKRSQLNKDGGAMKNGSSVLESRLTKPLVQGVSLLKSPGCGGRVSLRKRKPTEEEKEEKAMKRNNIMATPGSGSKKRKMCTPERVRTGGETWQKGEEFDLPEADQGTGECPDLPPCNISSITTVTRSEASGTSQSVNVEISLDPAVITVANVPTRLTTVSKTVLNNIPQPKTEQGSCLKPKAQNSTLRSVLLDPSLYTHPLLVQKPGISLLSGKPIHGSNGAIYPVTPSKTEAASESSNQPRPASAPGIGSSSPPQRDVLPLCCCKINGACVNKAGRPVIYCQALDSIDGKVMGCCNKVSSPQLVRPAVKIPFMAVCEVHRKRLRLHQCCPGCGHFCSQGIFYQCRKEGGSSTHHFHKNCQVFKSGKYFCPHCGEESMQFEVNLRLNEPRHMAKFGKAEPDNKPTISRAKMVANLNMFTPQENELSENIATASYVIQDSNKELSTAGLPFGPDRYSLEKILCLMPQDRPKKYRVLPKCMYGPAKEGDLDKIVYMLVDSYDVSVKYPDFDGQTALHGAAIGGSLPIVHVLLQAGSDVNCIDSLLKTPLMYASENNHLPILKYLIRAGASVHSRGEDGMTCFHLAAKAGHIEVMDYLLSHSDIDINVQDDGGWTPIIWAAEHRHVSSVKFLLEKGANPNLKDKEENTGLHWAAFSGSVDIAEIFINAGCDMESPNEHGDRPLHIAARQDHYECVVLILARGGDVDAKNNENEPAIGCCLDQNSRVWMALRINKQLKGFAAKRLSKTERMIHRDITLGKENNPIPGVNAVDGAENPMDYLYVTENCETTPLNINRTITSLQSCGCKDTCSSLACNCSRNSVKCWFDKDGRLLPEFNAVEPPLIFECNRACRCWTTCNNRVVQNGITCRLQLFRTHGRGWGVKTLLDIPQGSFICEYIGELISDSEADRREDDSYLFDLDNKDGETYCIDARKYGNIARFINHLCEPNIIPVKVFVEHQDLRFPRICFYSSREIKAQEELGFDYGEKFWMIKWKQFTCSCGSPKCKYSSETIQKTLEEYKLRHEDDDTLRE